MQDPETNKAKSKELIEIAKFHFVHNEYRKALEFYEKALKLDPQNPQIFYNMGIAYESLNDLRNAKQCYEAALKLAPDFEQAKERLSKIIGTAETG